MKKRKLYLTQEEWQLAVHALNDLRNKRISEGKTTHTIDDTLIAVLNAKTKRRKIVR